MPRFSPAMFSLMWPLTPNGPCSVALLRTSIPTVWCWWGFTLTGTTSLRSTDILLRQVSRSNIDSRLGIYVPGTTVQNSRSAHFA